MAIGFIGFSPVKTGNGISHCNGKEEEGQGGTAKGTNEKERRLTAETPRPDRGKRRTESAERREGSASSRGNKEPRDHRAGVAGTRLTAGEVMEVVHGGAAQVAEHEPEDGLENFFGCRRHGGRVSQVRTGSRIIVNDALFQLRTDLKLNG